MLQKELAKRLRGRFETEPDGDGWLAVSSDGMPLCRVKYNGNCIVNGNPYLSEEYLGKIAEVQNELLTVKDYVALYEHAPQMKAADVSEYRQLASFGDTVMAAKYSENHGFEFVTWKQNADGNAVFGGDYSPSYETVENTMKAIETAMTEKGLPAERTKEAQVLYVLALSDYADQADFVSKLVGCFAEEQTDEQLITAVNAAFGTELKTENFTKVMTSIRAKAINTSAFTDPDTKNAHDLAEWAKQAYAKKWGYVYGTYGEVLSESILTAKVSQYPEQVGDNEEFIRSHWLGVRTADCIGLIKGYAWYNCETGQIEYRSNGVTDMGSDSMLDMATEKGTIDTMPDIPGIAVWKDGHIGVYVGDGQTIHAANTELGVIMTPLEKSSWTHWLKIPYISYADDAE